MDKPLKSAVRKGKWLLIVAALFGLFMVSFLVNPDVHIKSEGMDISFPKAESHSFDKTTRSVFELPVDSFQNHLKSIIHENLPEKE